MSGATQPAQPANDWLVDADPGTTTAVESWSTTLETVGLATLEVSAAGAVTSLDGLTSPNDPKIQIPWPKVKRGQ